MTALPVVLSTLRLVLAVVFPLAGRPWQIGVVIVATLSDVLDGFAARKLGTASWWGGLLDAGCDKIFALAVLVTFAAQDRLLPWQVILLLVRDVTIVPLAFRFARKQRWQNLERLAARPLGKATTAALFLLFLVILVWPQVAWVNASVFLIAAFLSVAAAVDYLIRFGWSPR